MLILNYFHAAWQHTLNKAKFKAKFNAFYNRKHRKAIKFPNGNFSASTSVSLSTTANMCFALVEQKMSFECQSALWLKECHLHQSIMARRIWQ